MGHCERMYNGTGRPHGQNNTDYLSTASWTDISLNAKKGVIIDHVTLVHVLISFCRLWSRPGCLGIVSEFWSRTIVSLAQVNITVLFFCVGCDFCRRMCHHYVSITTNGRSPLPAEGDESKTME